MYSLQLNNIKRALLILILITIYSIANTQETYTLVKDERFKAIEYSNKARVLIDQKKGNEALNLLIESVALDSTLRETYKYFYMTAKLNKDFAHTVILALQKGVSIYKDDDELHFYLGEMYRKVKNYKLAIIQYDKAIYYAQKKGNDYKMFPYYYLNRANCYLIRRQYNFALVDYNSVIQIKPDFDSAITNRGICHYNLGNREKACKDWEKGKKMGNEKSLLMHFKYCVK